VVFGLGPRVAMWFLSLYVGMAVPAFGGEIRSGYAGRCSIDYWCGMQHATGK